MDDMGLTIHSLSLCTGRRRELIVASLVYGSGALITAFANSFALLLVGRLWFGVGIGLVCSPLPPHPSSALLFTVWCRLRFVLVSSYDTESSCMW